MLSHRRDLVARSAAYRNEIARSLDVWKQPLDLADGALELAGHLRRNAVWIVAGIVALFALQSLEGGSLRRVQTAWRSARSILGLLSGPAGRL